MSSDVLRASNNSHIGYLQESGGMAKSKACSCATSIFLTAVESSYTGFKRLVDFSFFLLTSPFVCFSSLIYSNNKEVIWTTKVCEEIGRYFLAPYKKGTSDDIAKRWISRREYVVQRYNHGLAHGLRQGALAKDIVDLVLQLKNKNLGNKSTEVDNLISWINKKTSQDPDFFSKLELASSFQRSGRQKEGPSSAFSRLYKQFERDDSIHFRDAAAKSPIFKDDKEILIFQEAILWTNKGKLKEKNEEDLKFLKRILHAAHTFDLRRMLSFDETRIKADGLEQLFGAKVDLADPIFSKIAEALWNRSGKYLQKTGDRDLASGRELQNQFFIQSNDPKKMINAIYKVRNNRVVLH